MKKHSACTAGIRYFILAASLLFSTFLAAQNKASLSGKVSDAKGVAIPGAGISISNSSGKVADILTDWDGSFLFREVPEGTYRLTVEIVGFVKTEKDGVDTSADSSRSLVIALGSLPRPAPPKTFSRQTRAESGKEAQNLEAPTFQQANVTDLPGINQYQQDVSQTADSGTDSSRRNNLLFINGNAANLDAGNLSDPQFMGQMMDAARMMGFQVREFNPTGEEGGSGGGMSFISGSAGPMAGPMAGGMGDGPGGGGPGGSGRGGGPMGFTGMGGGRNSTFKQPAVEGNLSETYSNSALNARNYSLTGKTLAKPVQIQNDFGFTIGGVLPFFKSKSDSKQSSAARRSFRSQPGWSITYSGNRNRSAMDILTTVPTELERAGDFSKTYTQALVIDPATGHPTVVIQPVQLYLNPLDASSRFARIDAIDPVANRLLHYIPHANLPCVENALCVNNYASERSLPTTSDQVQFSLSGIRLTSKDNIGFNYSLRRGSSLNASSFPGLDTTRKNRGQNIGISGVHNFNQRLITNWRVTLNRVRTESTNDFSYKNNVEGDLGITGVSPDPINWGPPTISFTNYGNISLASPTLNQNQTFSVSAGLNKIGKKHSFQTGGDISWNQRNSQSDSNGRGTFTFTGYGTVLLDANGNQTPGTGNDFADFLLGLPYSTSRRYVDPIINPQGNAIYIRNRSWNLFVMDNWRIRSNLTVNYGLRYEYSGPGFEKYDRLASLDADAGFVNVAQVFPNQKGVYSGQHYSRSLLNPDRNNFAPRVGIAWKPKAQSPLVFRAGYGIGYNAGYSSLINQLVNQPPFAVNQLLASNRSNPSTLQNGFPANPDGTIQNTYAINPDYKASYAQQWNLSIQAQLSQLYVLNVSYNGSKGTGLDIYRSPRRSSNASSFIYQTNGGSSIYHGMTVQFSRRYSRGFNITNSYTFSKSIDDVSGGSSSVAQNDTNLAAERALSNQDRRHNFQTNLMYELPIGKNRKFFATASAKLLNIIAGWSFNGSFMLSSGTPLTARYASSNGSTSGTALYNSLRPDVTGVAISIPRGDRTVQEFFNTAAFSIPSGEFGNAGRNTITGPGTNMVNLSLRKSFQLDENRRRLDVSCQVQNLLNHPNWSSVSTTVNTLNFGQVTGVRQMRSITTTLRIRF
jgi:trimeric autotransporter adhesin